MLGSCLVLMTSSGSIYSLIVSEAPSLTSFNTTLIPLFV